MQFDDDFPDEQAAALALFRDTTTRLHAAGVKFVVVGGWVTWFFHGSKYDHPGTFDVDVLLQPESLADGTFDAAADAMLSDGYLRAAKNRYQIHRVLRVNKEPMIFHADFLNENGSPDDLDVAVGKGRMQSIYTPAMKLVLRYGDFRKLSPQDWPGLSMVLFPSIETFIATKAAAALVKKRRRDAFDIFVSLDSAGAKEIGERWKGLETKDGMFREAADSILDAVRCKNALAKVRAFLPAQAHADAEQVFADFLGATGRHC